MPINKDKLLKELQLKYPEAGIESVDFPSGGSSASFTVRPKAETLAFLEKGGVIPKVYKEKASVISRDVLSSTYLDLGKPKTAYESDPKELYNQALKYYAIDPYVGSVVDMLSSIAVKGFENDSANEEVKNFFDNWAFDVNLYEVLEWIFFDLFKVSQVTTYKILGKYESKVNNLSTTAKKSILGKVFGAKKYKWSKAHIPLRYTVLNPLLVNITGSLLFDNTTVTISLPTELKETLNKDKSELSLSEKELIKALPRDLKRAIEDDEDLLLDSNLIGTITYKKAPYERYARPRISRIMESLNYKKALTDADISTVDGISNAILKITIGNDEFPVTSQEELEAVAELFNTPNKSFDVVWNHTLKIEKIVSPEIESILGKEKYAQVNEDISIGLGVTRALIDGLSNGSQSEVEWAIKGVRETIEYARRQVSRWVYGEYKAIAEAAGFEEFPKVRWDDSVLRDDILYKNVIAQMVDRRMISYNTALETLGFDYENELRNMEQELPLIHEGIFGIIGSPFQQSASQDTTSVPEGTPSNGRPTGQTNTKTKTTDPNDLPGQKPSTASKEAFNKFIKNLSKEDYNKLQIKLNELRYGDQDA